MSFFEEDWQPEEKEIDPRVNAWKSQKLATFGNATENEMFRQAHNSPSNASSSIVGGKIVKAIHAEPRSNLPSNVHGYNSSKASQSSWAKTVSNNTSRVGSSAGGIRLSNTNQPAKSENRSPAFDKIAARNAPVSSTTSRATADSRPPHMRAASIADSTTSTASTVPGSQHSKRGTRGQPSMNPGVAAKSAKLASKFPCSYGDCSLGFETEKERKSHKDEEHPWCRPCDTDFRDDDDLLFHKINNTYHICCCVCGMDFRSEAGRDRHQRQMHATQQDCKCVGCGHVFARGAALVDHIYENKCKDRSSRLPTILNQELMRAQRAQAALHMDALCHRQSDTGKLIAAIQPSEDGDAMSSIATGGGVPLDEQHILDKQDEESKGGASTVAVSQNGDVTNTDLMDFSDTGSDTPTEKPNNNFPSLAEASLVKDKGKGKGKAMATEASIIEGLNKLNVNVTHRGVHLDSEKKPPEWAAGLFAGQGQGTGPTMIDYRHAIIPGNVGHERRIATDWDHMKFTRHAVDGHYHCPFSRCGVSSLEVDDLKRHLTSGIHQGTDHRCLKCLKHFKNPTALVAHMESNSERCKIKETDQYGQMVSVVSGGFLGVTGRHADGSVKIEALTMEDLEEQAREQRALLPADDPDFPWNA